MSNSQTQHYFFLGILKSDAVALLYSTACAMFWYLVSCSAEPSLSCASLTPVSAKSLVSENVESTEWILFLYDCIFCHSHNGVDKELSSSRLKAAKKNLKSSPMRQGGLESLVAKSVQNL